MDTDNRRSNRRKAAEHGLKQLSKGGKRKAWKQAREMKRYAAVAGLPALEK